jgi:hypothetical protein
MSLARSLSRFALALFSPLLAFGVAPPTLDPAPLYEAWLGSWSGALEYRNYQPPHQRVALPTTLEVARATDGAALILRFVYDDGPGKVVKSTERLTLDGIARRLTWVDEGKTPKAGEIFSLSEASSAGDRLVFLGEAMDDNKRSSIRYTFTTTGRSWRILKETTSDGPEFAFRHEYRLEKSGGMKK